MVVCAKVVEFVEDRNAPIIRVLWWNAPQGKPVRTTNVWEIYRVKWTSIVQAVGFVCEASVWHQGATARPVLRANAVCKGNASTNRVREKPVKLKLYVVLPTDNARPNVPLVHKGRGVRMASV